MIATRKRCPTCGETDLSKFPKNKAREDGLGSHCSVCSNEYSRTLYKKRAEARCRQTSQYRIDRVKAGWTYPKNYSREYKTQHKGTLGIIITERICSTRKRAKANGWDFNLTPEDLRELYVSQKGVCYLSGRVMSLDSGVQGKKSLDVLSVDRIDRHKGYIKGNVGLTTWEINRMKFVLSNEDFISACVDVVNHRKGECNE